MSFKHGRNAEIWMGDLDVSSYFRSMEFSGEADTADTTTFKKSWKTHVSGVPNATLSLEGLYDPAQIDIRNSLGLAAGTILTTGPAGLAAVGDLARLVKVHATSFAQSSPVGDVVVFNYDVVADGPVGFGEVLKPLAAVTGDANGTTFVGPVGGSSNGAVAHLHVLSVSASDSVDVTIEDSTNGTDWDLLGTFANVTAAGVERIEIAGTVNRYLRAVWDVTGTDVSINFGVAIARL